LIHLFAFEGQNLKNGGENQDVRQTINSSKSVKNAQKILKSGFWRIKLFKNKFEQKFYRKYF
jgi:hypothetical protein